MSKFKIHFPNFAGNCMHKNKSKPQYLICSHNLMKNIQDLNRESYICCWEQVEKMATFCAFEWENFTTPMQSAFQSTPSHCWLCLSLHPETKQNSFHHLWYVIPEYEFWKYCFIRLIFILHCDNSIYISLWSSWYWKNR